MFKELEEYIQFIKHAQVAKPTSCSGIIIDPQADFQCKPSAESILKPGKNHIVNSKQDQL